MQGCSPEDVATINRLVGQLNLANPHDKEDAKQEAWVGWLGTGGNEQATWSHLVAWKQRGERQSALATNETDLGPGSSLGDVADEGSGQEASGGLYVAIDELPERVQDAMRLRIQGYAGAEIADRLGVSLRTVGRRIHEGKAQLKPLLAKAEG